MRLEKVRPRSAGLAVSVADAVGRRRESDDLTLVRRANQALQSAWSKRILPEPILDREQLANIAMRRERQELDGGHWEEGLRHLSYDLQQSARLNPLGRTIAHGLLVRSLRQRIRAARLWRRHPAILDQTIEKPVLILGHMRSGTTRLHRLLACDPKFAFTRFHESLQPVPGSTAQARVTASAIRRFMSSCNPHLRYIHPVRANAAEEEFGLHAVSLHGAMFEAQWAVPSFARWCERRDLAPVYDDFRRLVQTLRWRRREPAGKIQLLKAPQFMQDLDAVRRAFPDARIIHLERDRSEIIASSASLVWHQQRIQSDHADPLRIGAEWRRKTELREERARTTLSQVPSSALLTVDYEATNRDWRREVRRIYDFLGIPISDSVLGKMTRLSQHSDHAGHHYSREQFGLA